MTSFANLAWDGRKGTECRNTALPPELKPAGWRSNSLGCFECFSAPREGHEGVAGTVGLVIIVEWVVPP